MKSLLLSFVALAITSFSSAQIRWGIKGALNLSSMRYSGISAANASNFSFGLKPGVNVGAIANIPLSNPLSLQPELSYSMEGSKVSTNYEKVVDRFNFINLPIMLQYKIGSRFFAAVGPQASFLITAKKKVNSTTTLITETPNDPSIDQPGQVKDIKNFYNTFILSGAIGVGYHINKNFGADLRFTHGLTKLTKNDGIGNNQQSYNYRNYSFQLGILYMFSNQTKK